METVTLGGEDRQIVLPSLSIRRDIAMSVENERRARLAALGLCVELPRYPGDPPLGPAGWRAAKGNVYDFAEIVEGVCEKAGLDAWECLRAGAICWLACQREAMPSLGEGVSRVDFGSAEEDEGAGTTTSPSSSASGTAATLAGSTA